MLAGKLVNCQRETVRVRLKMVVVYVILLSQSMQCHVSRSYERYYLIPVWMTVLSKITIQSYNTHS